MGEEPAPPASVPAVSAIVVSHNTRDLTLGALRSLLDGTRLAVEVLVVDNGSHDGSAEAIREAVPEARVTAVAGNVGFARAVNGAAREARAGLLLLLNPDTVVAPGAVDALVAFSAERPEALIWGGATLDAEGRPSPDPGLGRMTLWSILCRSSGLSALAPGSRLLDPEQEPPLGPGEARRVAIVRGCLLLVGRRTWDALGGFDPAFFVYGEDVDLCLRARRLGARPMLTGRAVIAHVDGASRRSETERGVQLLAARGRNARLHLPAWQRPLALWIMRLGVLARAGLWRASGSAAFRRRPRRIDWPAAWARRGEWWSGYPDRPSGEGPG